MKALIKRYPLASYFVITYAFSWTFWIPTVVLWRAGYIQEGRPSWWIGLLMVGIGAYGVSLTAILLAGVLEGEIGVSELFSRFRVWRVRWWWYLVVFLLPPLTYLITIVLYATLGSGAVGRFEPQRMYLVFLLPLSPTVFLFCPLAEELGWRGYVLPRLQQRYSALKSSLILGIVWAVWHAPLFWSPDGAGGVSGGPVTPWAVGTFILAVLAISVLMTWVFNYTEGSVLLAFLFHAAGNGGAAFALFPELSRETIRVIIQWNAFTMAAFALAVILVSGTSLLLRQKNA